MSTGADCRIEEKSKGSWFYSIQCWPYGQTEEYDTFGPFPHFKAAQDHLFSNHANPGGYRVHALPGCPHDMQEPSVFGDGSICERCGTFIQK
jgi:hypothetical protein